MLNAEFLCSMKSAVEDSCFGGLSIHTIALSSAVYTTHTYKEGNSTDTREEDPLDLPLSSGYLDGGPRKNPLNTGTILLNRSPMPFKVDIPIPT